MTRGRAVFELDGERRDAPSGHFVFVRPHVTRTAFAEEPGTTIVSVGGSPGKPYEPVGWELWYPLRKQYEAGEHEEVRDAARERSPPNPSTASVLQPRLPREPHGRPDGGDRAPRDGDRDVGAVPRVRHEATPTSTRCVTSRLSRSSSAVSIRRRPSAVASFACPRSRYREARSAPTRRSDRSSSGTRGTDPLEVQAGEDEEPDGRARRSPLRCAARSGAVRSPRTCRPARAFDRLPRLRR